MLADAITSAFVFVVGGDVADAGVPVDGVVLRPDAVQLGVELTGVADLLQVRPLALDVAEQGLDPGLVLRVCGRPNCWAIATPARNSRVVTDFICGQLSEMASSSGICPSPARPCTWSFSPLAIAARSASVAPLVGLIQQVLGVQRGEEAGLDLGRGLLRAGEGGQPLAGDHVQDGDRGAPGAGPVGEVVGHTRLGFSLGI